MKLIRRLRGSKRQPKNAGLPSAEVRIGSVYRTPDEDAVPLKLEGEPPVAQTKGWRGSPA